MRRWLAQVRHDLIKHAAWRARDLLALRDLGAAATAADLEALRRGVLDLPDEEGAPVGALARWRQLRGDAPEGADEAALGDFEAAVAAAEVAVRGGDGEALAAVLALEDAFTALARRLDPR